jgi:hypothetical protein
MSGRPGSNSEAPGITAANVGYEYDFAELLERAEAPR